MKIWPKGWFTKKKPENTTYDLNDDKLFDIMSDVSAMSAAGIKVNEKNAMKFSAVYACVSLMAGVLAGLPKKIKTERNGYEEDVTGSRLLPLLNRQPNIMTTSFVFWETILLNFFLSGNGYAVIYRTKLGDPRAIYWIPSQNVSPKFNQQKTRILYHITLPEKTVVFDQDDVLHFPCIGWDGLRGMSPISAASEGIGLGLAGEKFNAHYFTNSITSDVSITYPKALSAEAKSELEKYLKERYSNIDNLRKPFIGMNGAEVKNLGMSASDAQMIEGRDYQVEDICRFYGVPPWMVGALKKTTSWGTGLGEQVMGFAKFTLTKHIIRFEQEIDKKLIRNPQRFCKFNLDALLRADIKTRNEAYKVALGGNQAPGYVTPNEIRKKEGYPPNEDEKSNKIYQPPEKPDNKGIVPNEENNE